MPKRKSKKQTRNHTKKPEIKQKTEPIEPEVKVNYEEISTLDIVNRSDNYIKGKGSVLTYAKKNPEYAAFIFTIVTTTAYFLIRMVAFIFFSGQCLYNKVEIENIKVDSDAVIFSTIIGVVLGVVTTIQTHYEPIKTAINRRFC